jgi:hypothetical protein
MPIRINLLAEQKLADDVRRRDPVKRAVWIGSSIVGVLVLWSAVLQVRLVRERIDLKSQAERFASKEKAFQTVTNDQNQVVAFERKLVALDQLHTNRFLWGNVLNALQFSWVDNIQITRLRGEQTFTITEATKPAKGSGGSKSGAPATSRESLLLVVDSRDFSARPGEQVFRFQESVTNQPFFGTNGLRVELIGRSPTQTDPAEPNRPFVAFTLSCQFPERVRTSP